MKNRLVRLFLLLAIFVMLAVLPACSDDPKQAVQEKQTASTPASPSSESFLIYAGSEMSGLAPMIMKWAKKKDIDLRIEYKGSIDMMRMMADGTNTPVDAYWPAHTIWFILGDTQHKIKNKRSIMVSPIVAGLKKSKVEELGWDTRSPDLEEFLAAARDGKFKYAKTSSTQSNSGALFHLAAWWVFAGKPDNWTMDIVKDKEIQEKAREMEATVASTSGSSGWLKSKMIHDMGQLDGMINYEAMISEANIGWTSVDKHTGKEVKHKGLIQKGEEPLHVVYLSDATMMADHPLGYVDKGNSAKAGIFEELQAYLLTPKAQKKMIRLGRRNRLLGMDASLADKNAFNPDQGFDVSRVIAPIQPPREEVLTAILDLYQEKVRKPSATFWVIDDSGSMYKNGGKQAVQEAMSILLTPAKARQFKLQPTSKDIHVIIPFSNIQGDPIIAQGNDPAVLEDLMEKVRSIRLGGGTNMYSGVISALSLIKTREQDIQGHFPAIAVLSDGVSKGALSAVLQAADELGMSDIPIHTLSFGTDVDERQLKEMADQCGGRYFSGKTDVAKAFRKMKGYN